MIENLGKTGGNNRSKRAICGICSAGCWVVVTYDQEGRIADVVPDGTSPLGMLCRTGELSRQVVYSPDRLLYPMRRKGPKGSSDFQRISWDEAYDFIVERLHRTKADYGPEAIAIYTGSGSFEPALCDFYQPRGVAVSSASSVLFPFGSPNTLGVGALCYVSFAMIAPHVTMGRMFINTFTDIENADLIVIWGKNPAAHCPPHDFMRIQAAHKRGASIIVIDPRRTSMAKYPEAEWIPIRPGTDGALALGLCHVLIEEELYDYTFVSRWTTGFDSFAAYAQHYRPEVVEHITGVPAEKVRDLARKIAAADGLAPVMYSGLEYSDGAVQAIRATFVLWALAGQLDRPGGLCFSMPGSRFPINREGNVSNPDPRKAAGYNDFPVYTKYRGEFHAGILPKAVLEGKPYPIRLLISLGASLITSWPNSSIWRKTLGALDFLVCIDRQMTADAAYADIVLPAATYYEIESYMVYDSMFRIRERVIEPLGEARNDFFILSELADRLGYGHLYPRSEEELLRSALKGSGYTLEEVRAAGGAVQAPSRMMEYRKWEKGLLRPDGRNGFDTPSGKFEIASSILEEHGYDPLPIYTEPGESPRSNPELAWRFPLVFNSGARSNVDLHALHLSIADLKSAHPAPTVMINTRDAADRGIYQGDQVSVRTSRGEVRMYAVVTDDIVAGAVEANSMGGGPLGGEAWGKANINELTDLERYDPISGFPVYKALLCDVVKVEKGGKAEVSGPGEYTLDPLKAEKPPARFIYLDHNATTPIHPDVAAAVSKGFGIFGNPSSLYGPGREAKALLERARRNVALLINTTARRITFTSGGTESNNMAIKGVARALGPARSNLITSAIEHPSVLNAFRGLEEQSFQVTYLKPDGSGLISVENLQSVISDSTGLVSIMTANNETGVLQPIRELARAAHERGALFHTDGVQAVGKIPVDVEEIDVDLLSLSGHKFYGPKGIGALFVRKGVPLLPLIEGGKQEMAMRGGTENLPGIAGLGRAAELALDNLPRVATIHLLRDALEDGILRIITGARINGRRETRLPHTSNITLPGIRGESLVLALDLKGVAVSSGSACHAGSPEPSHALVAMGLTEEEAHCSLRFSLGISNTMEEVDYVLRCMKEIVETESSLVRFVSCR
ncbi:MAG: aminotransferase class V-fold PLP-dependent enzyme [Desulfobacteraceae bacterium]|nr:MAG: aminotransferase class V-fold PLP-dependent enzyme [Desulfobacteraceae bacterium]